MVSSKRVDFPLSRPRVDRLPSHVGTYGPKVCAFVEACGMTLFDWQKLVLDRLFAVDSDDEWAATEFGLLVARQNGKGEILVAYSLAHLFLFPRKDNRRKTVIYTAHETKTSDDGMQRIKGVIEANPELMERVANIYTGNGQESIVLKPRPGQTLGDRIKFLARSKSSGRGFSGDIIIQDEAQEESQAAHTALTYTQSAVPNRQELFVGTVPEDGVNECEVFEGVRDRGRAGEGRTGWLEWTPDGSDDPKLAGEIDLGSEDVWLASNPSCPELIGLDTIAEQLERDVSPGAVIFGRERLSIWPNRPEIEVVASNSLDLGAWGSTVQPASPPVPDKGVVVAPVVADNSGYGSVFVAWSLDDGDVWVEHVATRPQTAWMPGFVAGIVDKYGADSVVMDKRKNAAIIPGLAREKVKYLEMNATEVASAYALTVEAINDSKVFHRDQPEVTVSLQYARPRKVGAYGFTWEQSKESEPVSQAQALTNAIWGVANLEAHPAKKSKVRGVRG